MIAIIKPFSIKGYCLGIKKDYSTRRYELEVLSDTARVQRAVAITSMAVVLRIWS